MTALDTETVLRRRQAISEARTRRSDFENEEAMRQARLEIIRRHDGDARPWNELQKWQQQAIAIARKFSLNDRQRLAFLLIVHHRMLDLDYHADALTPRKPFKIILGGPGGTGKTHVYKAVQALYDLHALSHELMLTTPTGVSAVNLKGSTIHSMAGLLTSHQTLVNQKSKASKEHHARWKEVKTLVIDEVYFLPCRDLAKTSQNIGLTRPGSEEDFGGLDVILSGDQFQLPPPGAGAKSLFDGGLTSILTNRSRIGPLQKGVIDSVKGLQIFWNVENVVLLNEVKRQVNPRFISLLNRLRRGIATTTGDGNDLDFLRKFVIGSAGNVVAPGLTAVDRWIDSPTTAPPLVTYTNSVRDIHNDYLAKAFAHKTGRKFAYYYSEDARGHNKKRVLLRGRNQKDAWLTPPKRCAGDLAGRLPLVIGQPIFLVNNLATELGIANGSGGTLVDIKYEVRSGRRYLINAVVDLPSYNAPEGGHRLVVYPVKKTVEYLTGKRSLKRAWKARRTQLPIVGGFAFTAHNSQGRSLSSAVVHLQSVASLLPGLYVMLSRVIDESTGLGILGPVTKEMLDKHASPAVRQEEKRLEALADKTMERAKVLLEWYTIATRETFV